jgi:hypothetical protein
VDFYLHNHLIIPPAVPLVRGEGGDVHIWTLGPVLKVVAADGGRLFFRKSASCGRARIGA